MKYHLPLGLVIATLAIPSFAQSKFEGFYGQVGVGYESVNPTLTNTPISVIGTSNTIPLATSISSTSGATGNVALGYTASVTKDFTLAIGAEYYPFNSQSGNYSSKAKGGNGTSGTYQNQNVYNIYLAPGMNVGTDGLAYFKVGYAGNSFKSSSGSASETQNLNGYSLGLGYKQFFAGNWYGFGEANYFSYNNVTETTTAKVGSYNLRFSNTVGMNVYNFLVGVGYKF